MSAKTDEATFIVANRLAAFWDEFDTIPARAFQGIRRKRSDARRGVPRDRSGINPTMDVQQKINLCFMEFVHGLGLAFAFRAWTIYIAQLPDR
jgi:hypothetical protein